MELLSTQHHLTLGHVVRVEVISALHRGQVETSSGIQMNTVDLGQNDVNGTWPKSGK